MKLAVLVMCGGQGKRLWPLSSAAQPKQFLAYPQQYSLFVQTLQRNYLDGFAQIDYIIVTSKEYEQQVRAELEIFLAWLADAQNKLAAKVNFFLVLEEVGRNTFPALQAGLFTYLNTVKQPADYLLVTPSDHYIAGDYATDLQQALAKCSTSREVLPLNSVQVQELAQAAAKVAASGSSDSALLAQLAPNLPCICSLGVTPSEPSTELGYIWNRSGEVVFLEKPDLVQAQALLAQNQAAGGQLVLWNTGIWVGLLAKVSKLVESFGRREVFAGLVGELERKLVDKLENKLEDKVQLGETNASSASLYRVVFPAQKATQLPVESLDKALMEKIRLSCHPASFTWSDLGSWTAVTRLAQKVPEATLEQAPAAKLDDAALQPSNVQQASAVPVHQQHLKQQEHNLLAGRVHAHQVTNSFIRSYQKPIIAIGVDNLAIIENEDYIVVTALDRIDEARVLAEQAAASEQDREAALKQSTTSQAQNKNG